MTPEGIGINLQKAQGRAPLSHPVKRQSSGVGN
jgi:hypothetical protein